VIFKFRPKVIAKYKENFVHELKKLKELDYVKGYYLVISGPLVTDLIK